MRRMCRVAQAEVGQPIRLSTDGEITSREVAARLSVSKSAVNNHRAGTCPCAKQIADRIADGPVVAPQVVRPRVKHPTGFEPGHEWDGFKGYVNTGPLPEQPRTWDEFIRDAGLDPDEVMVDGPVNVRGWDANVGGGEIVRMHYYKLNLLRRTSIDLPDLPNLMKLVKQNRRRRPKVVDDGPDRAVVAVFADPQTGKVASRGGTAELVERCDETFERLGNYVADANADRGVWFDAGDAIESFNNTPAQQRSNDLSSMSQVDAATTIEFAGIDILAKLLPSVVVAGVGSNHCQERHGKDVLDTPAQDWGLHIIRQMDRWTKTLARDAYEHVTFMVPKEHDESLAVDVCGTIIGLAHGHQVSRPNGIPDWWVKQQAGGQPIAHADILVTGHFHHLRVEPVGTNPYTHRSRWWLQAPTLDNGSDWYRRIAGYDSDPGMLVFTVTRDGWRDLQIL